MRYHVILDAAVDLTGHHAAFHQVQLGVVRPEANNAPGPTARHAGDFQQLIHAGVIDVDAIFRVFGCLGKRTVVGIMILRHPGQTHAQHHHRQSSASCPCSHGSILCLALSQPQAGSVLRPSSILMWPKGMEVPGKRILRGSFVH